MSICRAEDGRVSKTSVVGNMFLQGPSLTRLTKPIVVRTNGTYTLLPGSRVYVYDNRAPDSGSTYSDLVALTGGDVIPNLMSQTTAPVWNTGLVAQRTANSVVYSRVLSFAGARPRIATLSTSASFRASALVPVRSSTVYPPMALRAAARMPAAGRHTHRIIGL